MLAQYSIPLGENEATLVFTGSALTAEDFDALADFVGFAKKQFIRKEKARSSVPQISLSKPAQDLKEVLGSMRPPRFTPKQADDNSVLIMSHEEFLDAWKELTTTGEVVVVSPGDPAIYSLKENA